MNSPQISQQWTKIQQHQAIHLKVSKPNFIFVPKIEVFKEQKEQEAKYLPTLNISSTF